MLKKTHMLRCAQSPRVNVLEVRTLLDFSRASPLDLFEQPARGFFFSNLLRLLNAPFHQE
jgi:hypothetical protein